MRDSLMIHAGLHLMKLEYTQGVKEGMQSEVRLTESMRKAHYNADTYHNAVRN
jgi:hypothetical protein